MLTLSLQVLLKWVFFVLKCPIAWQKALFLGLRFLLLDNIHLRDRHMLLECLQKHLQQAVATHNLKAELPLLEDTHDDEIEAMNPLEFCGYKVTLRCVGLTLQSASADPREDLGCLRHSVHNNCCQQPVPYFLCAGSRGPSSIGRTTRHRQNSFDHGSGQNIGLHESSAMLLVALETGFTSSCRQDANPCFGVHGQSHFHFSGGGNRAPKKSGGQGLVKGLN